VLFGIVVRLGGDEPLPLGPQKSMHTSGPASPVEGASRMIGRGRARVYSPDQAYGAPLSGVLTHAAPPVPRHSERGGPRTEGEAVTWAATTD
jgi:hypothetical protein